ncbi:hypothetical protein FXO38_05307 [Capsicum annuum]|nr:hypothetical protein FXO37_07515 [Capsicum annuum]KAF3674283.1 hypothetical protein FXO38_05307 [Capsicum annuum]
MQIIFEILRNNHLLTCNAYVKQLQVGDILIGLGLGRNRSELFGNSSCVSLVLHYLLRELPIGIICSNALDILHLIECSNDYSFDQCLNYKLLGLRLCENISHVNEVNLVMKKVIQERWHCWRRQRSTGRISNDGVDEITYISPLGFVGSIANVVHHKMHGRHLPEIRIVLVKKDLSDPRLVDSNAIGYPKKRKVGQKMVEVSKRQAPSLERPKKLMEYGKFIENPWFIGVRNEKLAVFVRCVRACQPSDSGATSCVVLVMNTNACGGVCLCTHSQKTNFLG